MIAVATAGTAVAATMTALHDAAAAMTIAHRSAAAGMMTVLDAAAAVMTGVMTVAGIGAEAVGMMTMMIAPHGGDGIEEACLGVWRSWHAGLTFTAGGRSLQE